jgi:hypothetical protein
MGRPSVGWDIRPVSRLGPRLPRPGIVQHLRSPGYCRSTAHNDGSDTSGGARSTSKARPRTQSHRTRRFIYSTFSDLCPTSLRCAYQVHAAHGMGRLLHRTLNGKSVTPLTQIFDANAHKVFSILTAICQVKQVQSGSGKHQMFVDLPSTINSLRVGLCYALNAAQCAKQRSIFTSVSWGTASGSR